MYIGENYIYFELQKTASSQIRKMFKHADSLSVNVVGIHNSYYEVPKKVLGGFEEKLKIASVRNPWDWYVSLWFGDAINKVFITICKCPVIFGDYGTL